MNRALTRKILKIETPRLKLGLLEIEKSPAFSIFGSMNKRTLLNFLISVGIIFSSTISYFHDILTNKDGELRDWVPNLGLVDAIKDSEGYPLGFTNYRVLLYILGLNIAMHIGYLGWYFAAKGKPYRFFILVPVFISLYQIIINLLNQRSSVLNDVSTKFIITIVIIIAIVLNFYLRKNNEKNTY